VVSGTPITSSLQEVQGLLDFLSHEFGNKELWRTTIYDPFVRDRSAVGLCRMRALLRSVMLRRTKRQPHILRQMNLPPLTFHCLSMPLAPLERKAYDKAAAALTRSFKQVKPVFDAATRLRRRAVTGGGGFGAKNSAAKKSARFIGEDWHQAHTSRILLGSLWLHVCRPQRTSLGRVRLHATRRLCASLTMYLAVGG
jgi:hypothetical protein